LIFVWFGYVIFVIMRQGHIQPPLVGVFHIAGHAVIVHIVLGGRVKAPHTVIIAGFGRGRDAAGVHRLRSVDFTHGFGGRHAVSAGDGVGRHHSVKDGFNGLMLSRIGVLRLPLAAANTT